MYRESSFISKLKTPKLVEDDVPSNTFLVCLGEPLAASWIVKIATSPTPTRLYIASSNSSNMASDSAIVHGPPQSTSFDQFMVGVGFVNPIDLLTIFCGIPLFL